MNVRTLCLALLAHGEASGYDLKTRWADGPFAHFVDASFGSIYPALARLEDEGLVSCREEPQSGKPSRKVYAITPAGRDAFVATLSQEPGPDTIRSPFAVMALCAPFLEPAVVRRAMDARIALQRAELRQIEAISPECTHPAMRWLIDWGISHFSNEIAFLERSRGELEATAGKADSVTPHMLCQSAKAVPVEA